jgi:hypothetical protein
MTKKEQTKRIIELENILIKNGLLAISDENEKEKLSFSNITIEDLNRFVSLKEDYNQDIFNNWFNSDITLTKNIEDFLINLLEKEGYLLRKYKEEDLKLYFLSQIFNHIDFKDREKRVRFFAEANLNYESDNFILNGNPDFFISRGLDQPQKPYFFIQEFKQEKGSSDPEEQLLAELISGVELNNWREIKGCYIKGENWRFVILKKVEKNDYVFNVSKSFNSSNLDELKAIYKNLLFIKNEVFQKILNNE